MFLHSLLRGNDAKMLTGISRLCQRLQSWKISPASAAEPATRKPRRRPSGQQIEQRETLSIQYTIELRKMLNEVPKATVVVTNPTHFAVALRYDGSRDEAPVVVARGAGAFAKRIIAEARKGGVVVVQRPALARAIYRSVKEGMVIPGQLFKAVAEVLAFVYKIRGMAA